MTPFFTSIILAGGKGSRMGTTTKHKSLFEIAGKPAIFYLLDTLNSLSISNSANIVVVGAFSEQIMATLSINYNNILFAFQPEQKGTGNAAKYGAKILENLKIDLNPDCIGVYIVAGDAFIEKEPLELLTEHFLKTNSDLSFLVAPKKIRPDSGRIVLDEKSQPIASIEYWDLQKEIIKTQIYEEYNVKNWRNFSDIEYFIYSFFGTMKNIKKILPDIEQIRESVFKGTFDIEEFMEKRFKNIKHFFLGNKRYSAEEIENNAQWVNVSVYLVKPQVLFRALPKILRNNTQNEEYLTDIIQIIANMGKKVTIVPYKEEGVMAFNNPEELLMIEEYLYRKGIPKSINEIIKCGNLKHISDWVDIFSSNSLKLNTFYNEIYGLDSNSDKEISLINTRYISILKQYAEKFSDHDHVAICRSPGRINLMGRHIDHRGGNVNMCAINREVIVVASIRNDDLIIAYNEDSVNYLPNSFSISDILSQVDWDDWFSFLNNQKINEMIRTSQGEWINYLKAAALRLQIAYKQKKLRGINLFISSSIPQAAGLSSSSALVVATVELLSFFNGIPLKTQEFIDLCGEGEWFVGTRGGCSDHAAIKTSKKHMIKHLSFFNFEIKGEIIFPPDYELIIVNSGIRAEKSGNMMLKFNEKIIGYEIGFEILKSFFPAYDKNLHYLRDFTSSILEIPESHIYQIIKRLPTQLTLNDAQKLISSIKLNELTLKFRNYPKDRIFPVRDVILFGLAEIKRAKICKQILECQNVKLFGDLMNISHNGDRIVKWQGDQMKPYYNEYSESIFDELTKNQVPLESISGNYACSIPEIDFIVDCVLNEEGVMGSQISGAGLGGCAMILVKKEFGYKIIDKLLKAFYLKFGKKIEIILSVPIEGAGLISIDR
jgi:N-acetylgalactosamine kinase